MCVAHIITAVRHVFIAQEEDRKARAEGVKSKVNSYISSWKQDRFRG